MRIVDLENALLHHGIGDLLEARDVRTGDQVVAQAILLSGLSGDLVDVDHHLMELCIDLFRRPDETLGVLAHFQSRDADAACVDSLGRSNDHVLLAHQIVQGVVRRGHVGDFDVIRHAVGDDLLGGLHVDVVLHGRRHDHVGLDAPRLLAGEERDTELVGIVLHAVAAGGAHLEQVVDLLLAGGDAFFIIDVAVRTGQSNDLRAQMQGLLADAPRHVAEAGAGDGLALDLFALVLEDFLQVIHGAVAGRLRTGQAAAVAEALAGEDAVLERALQAAILAEQVADLAAANAHITGGNIDVRPDVAVQSRHIALAETHNLGIGLAGRVKVGTALAAADGKASQGVLEDLLKAEELDDAGINKTILPTTKADRYFSKKVGGAFK